MREILFRGKRIDNGKWIEGYYCKYETTIIGGGVQEHHMIVPYYASSLYGFEVDPSTIGQYTGLTDKNGKKIFEGDIIQDEGQDMPNLLYNVIFKDGAFLAHQFSGIFDEDVYLDNFLAFGVFDGVVIGNIHDNPELIGQPHE